MLGCDVDAEAMRLARAALRFPAAAVIPSDWAAIRAGGPYDVVTCNAVLCLHPADTKLDDLSPALPHAAVEETLGRLVEVLAPGGVLFAGDCNHPVGLSAAAGALVPVSLRGFHGAHEGAWSGTVERFGTDGRKFATRFLSPRLIAFPGFRALRPLPLDFEAAMLDRAWLRRPPAGGPLPPGTSRLEVSRPVPEAWAGWPETGRFERDLVAAFPEAEGLFRLRTAMRVLRGPDGRARVVREDSLATPDGEEALRWARPVRAEPGEMPEPRFRARVGAGAWGALAPLA